MKICIALHSCMDLGGIINHTEQLIGGLKDLGHTVHLKEMVYSERTHSMRKEGNFETGPSGIPFDQGKGWMFGYHDRIGYKTWPQAKSAQRILNEYDMVVWTVPVPPKNKHNLGNDKWPELYDLKPHVKQVAFIHDGNCRQGAPHLLHIMDKLSGLACVHSCALNGASHLPIPRALVVNPQHNPVREHFEWSEKKAGFVNMQTFKAWKHAHELVEAIAYMPVKEPNELREVAGKGIEYQYMTSENKCKPHYFHGHEQGIERWFDDMKFWEAAEQNGMTHHDYWNTMQVEQMLNSARILVDPSWSAKYSQVGGHWNRVVVDAMIRGCVPVAHSLGMGNELFKAGYHYIDIGRAEGPGHYAELILEAGNMSNGFAQYYRDNAREVLPMFDRVNVAERLIDLAHGNIVTQTGTEDKLVRLKYEDLMFNQYGVLA